MSDQKHILIVEDSADEREMYAQHLKAKGYQISTAADGQEAIDRANETHPNLILMDLWLPKMGGWQATHSLKSDERTRDCPVLVITGHAPYQPETFECDGWITKPCPLDQLDAEIERVLDRHPA